MWTPEREARLLELIREKAPEDLERDEIEELIEGVEHSETLREALSGELKFEQVLVAVTAPAAPGVDAILERSRSSDSGGRGWLLLLLVIGALIGGGLWWWISDGARPGDVDEMAGSIGVPSPTPGESGSELADPEPSLPGEAVAPGPTTAVADPAGKPDPEAGPGEPEAPPAPESPEMTAETVKTDVARSGESPPEGEVEAVELEPVPSAKAIVLEAEEFERANASVSKGDGDGYGGRVGVIHNSGKQPNWARYALKVPERGNYLIKLRYTAVSSRPVSIQVNGKRVVELAAREVTGSWTPEGQRWFDETVCFLRRGRNRIELRAHGMFPHIDKIAFEPVDAGTPAGNFAFRPELIDEPSGLSPRDRQFSRIAPDERYPGSARLIDWFAPVKGQEFKLNDQRKGSAHHAVFEGLARLRVPWEDDLVLELSPFDIRPGLALHLWSGSEGVSLHYLVASHTWVAYRVWRENSHPRPDGHELVTTDRGLHHRTTGGLFQLLHRGEEILMMRGDLVLLRAPLEAPPGEVYVEGKFRLEGIGAHRGEVVIPEPARVLSSSFESVSLTGLEWEPAPRDSRGALEKGEDGSVNLRGEDGGETQRREAILPVDTLHEGRLRLARVEPGVALYFRDRHDRRVAEIRWHSDPGEGPGLLVGISRSRSKAPEKRGDLDEKILPFSGASPWIRWVCGPNTLELFLGVDGQNWSSLGEPLRDVHGLGVVKGLGLEVEPGLSIELESLALRPLIGPRNFVEAGAWERSSSFTLETKPGDDLSRGDWEKLVSASRPEEVDGDSWRRALIVRTLEAGTSSSLVQSLLEELLRSIEGRFDPEAEDPETRYLAFLNDVVLLADTRGASFTRRTVESLLESLHRHALLRSRESGQPVFSRWGRILRELPLVAEVPVDLFPSRWIEHDLLTAAYTGSSEDLERTVEELSFWLSSASPDGHPTHRGRQGSIALLLWAAMVAELPGPGGIRDLDEYPDLLWHHPLTHELDKSTYNTHVELVEAIRAEAWVEAARILTRPRELELEGLIPHPDDPSLLQAFTTSVQSLLETRPELARAIREEFAPVGHLRLRQAMQQGRADRVAQVAAQFPGTAVEIEGREWLGHRALALGEFREARQHYRRIPESAPGSIRERVRARDRLAAAYLGERVEGELPRRVVFDGVEYGSEEFAAIIERRLEKTSSRIATEEPPVEARSPVIGGAFSGEKIPRHARARTIHTFEKSSTRRLNRKDDLPRDWRSRLHALSARGERLFLTSRNRLDVLEVDSGRLLGKFDQSHDDGSWPPVPFRPLSIADDLVLTRLVHGDGTRLHAVKVPGGGEAWRAELEGPIVSDAFRLDGEVHCLRLDRENHLFHVLVLCRLDDRGRASHERPLFQLEPRGETLESFRVARDESGVVISGQAMTFALDDEGRPRWIHRHLALPPGTGPRLHSQWHESPLLVDGSVHVCLPSVAAVITLRRDTGQRLWTRPLAGLIRLGGAREGRLLVEVEDALLALSASTGELEWRRELPGLRGASFLESPDRLLGWVAGRQSGGEPRLELLWLGVTDGEIRERRLVEWVDQERRNRQGAKASESRAAGDWLFHRGRLYLVHALNERLDRASRRGVAEIRLED